MFTTEPGIPEYFPYRTRVRLSDYVDGLIPEMNTYEMYRICYG